MEVLKAQGNAALAAGDMAQALDLYTQALDSSSSGSSSGSGSGSDDVQLRAVLLSNRSMVLLRLGRAGASLQDADACAALRPAWPKALCRRAAALHGLNRVAEALQAHEAALALEPASR